MSETAERPDQLEFRFRFELPERLAGWFFRVTPDSAVVTVAGDIFTASFGPWRVETPLANIAGAELTGPYSWPRIIGPARLSLKDHGLTFATTDRQGVYIRFRRPVTGVDPLGLVRHPGLTVTVDDAPALLELLEHAARASDEAAERARRHPERPVTDSDAEPTVESVMEDVMDDLQALTAKELRERARSLGIAGVSSMKKDELVDVLSHQRTG